MTDPLSSTTLTIKGFGGEFYRRGNAKRFRLAEITTLEDMASVFVNYHQPHDPLGVLRSNERIFQAEWLKSWVYSAGERLRFDILPEKFYVDFRLGHWNRPLGQATLGRITANPRVSLTAVKKNLELSPKARGTERFHFEVMRRAAPEIMGVPFLSDVWATDLVADSPIDLPRHPFTTVKPTKRILTTWQWPFLESEGRAIKMLFREAARETDMGAICDMTKLERIGRRAARLQNKVKARALLSGVYVALVLLGRAEPVLDRP